MVEHLGLLEPLCLELRVASIHSPFEGKGLGGNSVYKLPYEAARLLVRLRGQVLRSTLRRSKK